MTQESYRLLMNIDWQHRPVMVRWEEVALTFCDGLQISQPDRAMKKYIMRCKQSGVQGSAVGR